MEINFYMTSDTFHAIVILFFCFYLIKQENFLLINEKLKEYIDLYFNNFQWMN